MEKYARFLRAVLPSKYKIYRFFTDKEYARRYNIKEFPDGEFVAQYIKCIEVQERTVLYQHLTELKEYVLRAMGGFEIDGWKLRTPVTVD